MVGIAERDYYTVAEAAAVLDVSPSTVLRWIKAGRLPAQRVGPKTLRIRKQDVESMEQPVEDIASIWERVQAKGIIPMRPVIHSLKIPPMTDEEVAAMDEAFRLADELSARILKRRGGIPLGDSDVLIQEAREERSRQLLP